MPKIRILLADTSWADEWGSGPILRTGLTDWEDVSEEELTLLRKHLPKIIERELGYGCQAIIVQQDTAKVMTRLAQVRALVAELEAEAEAKRKAAELKKRERAKKRQLEQERRERELLESLKSKYE